MQRSSSLFRISSPRKLIFDLDRTLWKPTIEYHPHITKVRPFPGTSKMLTLMQKKYSLNIASRSSEREKCLFFLNQCFPTIHFDQIEIFPAQNKRTHLQNIVGFNWNEFIVVDDEILILDDLRTVWPIANTIWRHPQIHWDQLLGHL